MLSNEAILKPIITTDDFLEHFKEFNNFDLQNGVSLDFEFDLKFPSHNICPNLQVAKPEEAENIANMYLKAYNKSYPAKEMLNSKEVGKMIKNPDYHWFLFKIKSNIIVGCLGIHLEFDKKRGYLFGFVIKKKYRGIIDPIKTFAGCLIPLWKIYKNKILVWYSETRTAHSISQYGQTLCGLKPIAFLPNKDIFLNQVESNIFHIIHDEKVLKNYRCKKDPKIIRQVLNCYLYSNDIYHLGTPIIENPKINFDPVEVNEIKNILGRKTEKKKYGYEIITFFIKNSNSYFRLFHNINNKSVEKTTFKINKLEELFIFVQEIKEFINKSDVRYFECFVSSYEPTHQRILYDAGFKPRGYIPCWRYNKEKDIFEDYVVFNYYKGNIDRNIKLIPETEKLLQVLKFKTIKEEIFLNAE